MATPPGVSVDVRRQHDHPDATDPGARCHRWPRQGRRLAAGTGSDRGGADRPVQHARRSSGCRGPCCRRPAAGSDRQRRARTRRGSDRRGNPARRAAEVPRYRQARCEGQRRVVRRAPGQCVRRAERAGRRGRHHLAQPPHAVHHRVRPARARRGQRPGRAEDECRAGWCATGSQLPAQARLIRNRSQDRGDQPRYRAGQAHALHAAHSRRQLAVHVPRPGIDLRHQRLLRSSHLHRQGQVPEGRLPDDREGQAGACEGRQRWLARRDPALLRGRLGAEAGHPAHLRDREDRQQPLHGPLARADERDRAQCHRRRRRHAVCRSTGPARAGRGRTRARSGRRLQLADRHRQAAVLADAVPARHRAELGLGDRAAHAYREARLLPAAGRELPLDGQDEEGRP